MKIIRNKYDCEKVFQNNNEKSPLTYTALGFFDGVHLGHQALLKLCNEKAKKDHAISTVILFNPHPEKIIQQLSHFPLLTTLPEKIQRIKRLGIKRVVIIRFTDKFQKISAEKFINDILLKRFNMRAVFVGYNYHFGFQKKGDIKLIKRLSLHNNYKYYILYPKMLKGKQVISSTIIREQLKKGNVEKANELLGYHYQLSGKVIHGDQRGKNLLSCPTANIKIPQEKLLPRNGVYIVIVNICGERYKGMVNIGYKPTFGQEKAVSVEINIFNYNQNIYHKKITISLLKRIRDEIKFIDSKELYLQIKKDKIIADNFFQKYDRSFSKN